jgi:glutamyl-tRNA synthetase
LASQTAFFFAPPTPTAEASALLTPDNKAMLGELAKALASASDFSATALDALCKDFATQRGLKLNQVLPVLRAAICGTPQAPSISKILVLLGKEACLSRLNF